jgi:hypothetical protein
MAYNVKSPTSPRVPGLHTTLPHHVHITDKPVIHHRAEDVRALTAEGLRSSSTENRFAILACGSLRGEIFELLDRAVTLDWNM